MELFAGMSVGCSDIPKNRDVISKELVDSPMEYLTNFLSRDTKENAQSYDYPFRILNVHRIPVTPGHMPSQQELEQFFESREWQKTIGEYLGGFSIPMTPLAPTITVQKAFSKHKQPCLAFRYHVQWTLPAEVQATMQRPIRIGSGPDAQADWRRMITCGVLVMGSMEQVYDMKDF